jgi:pseudouridine-5'-phosphate glycosidase
MDEETDQQSSPRKRRSPVCNSLKETGRGTRVNNNNTWSLPWTSFLIPGMPFPRNLETAMSVESIIRKHGAIPATIGCLDGKLFVGMTSNEIELLAKTPQAAKISRRDFAVVAARGMTGGTTIAGTMILAHMAGIKVFATGVSD